MNGTRRGLIIAVAMLGCLVGAVPVRAQAELPWVWIEDYPTIAPNHKAGEPYTVVPQTEYFPVGCYDASSGRKLNCEVLWQEAFSLTGVSPEALPLWKGGHEHDRTAGDFDRTIGALFCEVDPNVGTDPALFHGFTLNKYWTGLKAMPEASGVIRVSAMVTFPPQWHCVPGLEWRCDPTEPSGRRSYSEIAFWARVEGLVELPANTALYSKTRGDATAHPNGFFGTPEMVGKVQEMATQFQAAYPGYILSFNDMSLPWGGLFDINHTWDVPHSKHRLGHSMDVNHGAQKPNGGTEDIFGKKEDKLNRIAGNLGLTRYEASPDRLHDLIHYEL